MYTLSLLHSLSPVFSLGPILSLLTPGPSDPVELPGIRPIIASRTTPRRWLTLFIISAISTTFLLDGAILVAYTVITQEWVEGWSTPWAVYALGNLVLWSGASVIVSYRSGYLRKGLVVLATVAFVLEIVILVYQAKALRAYHPIYDILHIVLTGLRILHLPVLVWAVSSPIVTFEPVTPPATTERDGLLGSDGASTPNGKGTGKSPYGTFNRIIQGEGASTNGGVTTVNSSQSRLVDSHGQPTDPAEEAAKNLLKDPFPKSGENGALGTAGDKTKLLPKGPGQGKGGKGKKGDKSTSAPADDGGRMGPNNPFESTWSDWFKRFYRLAPFLWPSKSRKLQVLACLCLVILVAGRAINLLVPQALGRVVATFGTYTNPNVPIQTPWVPLFLYIALRFCQGQGGILSVAQGLLWAPVTQYSDREMSAMSFNHLLDLSLAFHTKRKTGEVLRILDRGSAINNIFQLLLMQVGPVVFDILIATVYFYVTYGWTLALVIIVVMTSYLWLSIALTTYRTTLRRTMVERDVKTRGISADVLMNWESVKYFVSEDRESARYQEAIRAYQEIEFKVIGSMNVLNLAQNAIITAGLLSGTLIVAYRITKGQASAPQFVVFLTYLGQLYGPLSVLGSIYRALTMALVDAEKLLTLLDEAKEVVDKPDAKDLVVTDGTIEFRDVFFSYDGKVDALKDISFKIEKGEKVALVGHSGSGKSSMLRLLYRFYDIQGGEILIDGQNIRDVTQKTLRRAIGIVPQDAVLWNDTVGFNIGYGKEGATREDIIEAAKSAKLHERIMGFPDGYDTVVGERGVRLSGGEKQRVSLARTILKAVPILVLDEATSALDTSTERFVQDKLADLARGRSSLMIAHRLSTIIDADKIIVLSEGRIIEFGHHRDLINKPNGIFAKMWADQIRSEHMGDDQDGSGDNAVKAEDAVAVAVPDTEYGGPAQSQEKERDGVDDAVSAAPQADAAASAEPIVEVPIEPFTLAQTGSASAMSKGDAIEDHPREDADAVVSDPRTEGGVGVQQAEETPVEDAAQEVVKAEDVPGVMTAEDLQKADEAPVPKEESEPATEGRGQSAEGEDTATVPPPSRSEPVVPVPQLAFPTPEPSDDVSAATNETNPPELDGLHSPRAGMSRSNSGNVSIASTDESSSGKKDKDKRKRLSSIGGLVRRVSEQGKDVVRKAHGKSPMASPARETPPVLEVVRSSSDVGKKGKRGSGGK